MFKDIEKFSRTFFFQHNVNDYNKIHHRLTVLKFAFSSQPNILMENKGSQEIYIK